MRYLYHEIDWNNRLVGIIGARGVGKTTLLNQYQKNRYGTSSSALFVSLDHFYFKSNRLFDLADQFVQKGGEHLFIDEIHKYPDWAIEIKLIYDTFSSLRVTFTGSSALELQKAQADLSRRLLLYSLHELSFREYIIMLTKKEIAPVSLNEIMENHVDIASQIRSQVLPYKYFDDYLKRGSYPFFQETTLLYHERIQAIVRTIIENDFPAVARISYGTQIKIQKLLNLLADSVPFKPNIYQLAEKIGVSRDQILKYLDLLDVARIIIMLRAQSGPTGYLTKPEKIYLNNTTLMNALSMRSTPSTGTIRETFFLNQLKAAHTVTYPKTGDFLVNGKYLFEVGGKTKTRKQIIGEHDAFLVLDTIDIGFEHKIPLWLFGWLY